MYLLFELIVDLLVELWNFFKFKHFHAMFMFKFIQTLNKYVGYNIFYGNILKLNQVVLNLLFDEMILYIYVLTSIMEFWIRCQSKRILLISKKCGTIF